MNSAGWVAALFSKETERERGRERGRTAEWLNSLQSSLSSWPGVALGAAASRICFVCAGLHELIRLDLACTF